MSSEMEKDRQREAEHLCRELPPHPLTRRESETLQADPDYEVYWVRGHYGGSGETLVTQFVVRFNYTHLLAFRYTPNTAQWEVVATGEWAADIRRIGGDLDRAASPTTEWCTPLTDSLD